jgi:hypothetical protein
MDGGERTARVGVDWLNFPSVAVSERFERGDVPLCPAGQLARQPVDVVVGLVALSELEQPFRQLRLGRRHLADRDAELHARLSLQAADLNSGCFETGSQVVMVSSLAARPRPFGPTPSGSSQ